MQSTNSRNRFDKKDSLELGERAEGLFVNIARQFGWQVSASSKDENIDEHWDYHIEKEQENFKIEVKSAKRVHRNDNGIQFEYTWVEIHGVRPKGARTAPITTSARIIAFSSNFG